MGENEFTCIPGVLCARIGRPPPDWDHIPLVISEAMHRWNGDAPAKKRRKGGGGGDGLPAVPRAAAKRIPLKKVKTEDGDDQEYGEEDVAHNGHPLCTSAENCIGSVDDRTIRHLLNGKLADTYCEKCWDSFRSRHPNLEGEW